MNSRNAIVGVATALTLSMLQQAQAESPAAATSAPDAPAEIRLPAYLKADLVSTAEGKWVYRQVERCAVSKPGEPPFDLHIEWTAEAPIQGMNRDVFVYRTAKIAASATISIAENMGATIGNHREVMACVHLASFTGTPEIKVAVVFGAAGVNITITDTAQGIVTRREEPWMRGAAQGILPKASGVADPYEGVVMLMEEMAVIFVAHAENCDQMGDSLSKLFDDHSQRLETLRRLSKDSADKEAEKRADEKYSERMVAALGKSMPGQQKCAGNARVQAALARLKI